MSILEKISRFSVGPSQEKKKDQPEIKSPPADETGRNRTKPDEISFVRDPTESDSNPTESDRPVVIAILNACRPWCRGCGSMRAKEVATGRGVHLTCFCCGQTIDNDPDPNWVPRERVGLCV